MLIILGNMIKKHSLFVILLFYIFVSSAQQKLTNKATISVVTCGPGEDLYTAFGHSAFRVHDPILGIDKIYNYGTFDFNAPNFYLNFAKGKLTYQLSTTNFNYFLRIYKYENRWVKAQLLNLNMLETQKVFNFLENNTKPENKNYQYDFFYDNCSTKIEEVIKKVLNNNVTFNNNHITTHKSHRDLIADYTDHKFKWGKFGIDLALGSVIDDEATKDDYKFLPDYIFEAFNNATILVGELQKPLVKKTYTILKENKTSNPFKLLQPTFILLIISIIIIIITLKNFKTKKRSKYLDFLLFFVTGIIGVVVLLLWFATSHTATYKNLNFLWAFAPNCFVAFYLLKNNIPKWIRFYLILLITLLIVMITVWVLKIQIFNLALIPLLITMLIRYIFIVIKEK